MPGAPFLASRIFSVHDQSDTRITDVLRSFRLIVRTALGRSKICGASGLIWLRCTYFDMRSDYAKGPN